jgi:hypothetical protein
LTSCEHRILIQFPLTSIDMVFVEAAQPPLVDPLLPEDCMLSMHYAVMRCKLLGRETGMQRTVSMKSACTPILLRCCLIIGGGSTSLFPVPNSKSSAELREYLFFLRSAKQRTRLGYCYIEQLKMLLCPTFPYSLVLRLWHIPQKHLSFQKDTWPSNYASVL